MKNPDNNPDIKVPLMQNMAQSMNYFMQQGYTENFKATEDGLLMSLETEKKYKPEDLHVVNFFRYEGISDPSDNEILYVIETKDGAKGTMMDAYGAYADPNVDKFIKQVKIDDRG